MTTAAMVVGLVPLLLASGAGAASRFSIGIVIVAGMSIGTLFTLFVLPMVYTVLAKDHRAAATRQTGDDLRHHGWRVGWGPASQGLSGRLKDGLTSQENDFPGAAPRGSLSWQFAGRGFGGAVGGGEFEGD